MGFAMQYAISLYKISYYKSAVDSMSIILGGHETHHAILETRIKRNPLQFQAVGNSLISVDRRKSIDVVIP